MKMTIKSQLLITCISLTFAIIIAQNIFNRFFLEDYYINYQSTSMSEAFLEIKNSYDGTIETLESTAQTFENRHNLQILIFQEDSVVYMSQNEYLEQKPPNNRYNSGDFQINRAIIGNFDMRMLMNPTFGDNFYTEFSEEATIEFFNKTYDKSNNRNDNRNDDKNMLRLMGKFYHNDEEFFVAITLPMESIRNSVAVFFKTSSTISIVVLIFAVIVSILIGNRLTKPIKQIEETAYNLSKLDFSVEIDENINTIELHSLSKSINNMSRQLKDVIFELNQANEILQKDVDNQKKLELMRREFVANVSHEMKTPLTLLQMYSENLKNNVDNVDKEYYCNTIIEETEYLHKMVKSMLDISAIESGINALNYTEINISDLISQLIDRMLPLMSEIELDLNVGQDIIIHGDIHYLEQAMKNYITNALSHTDSGAIIKINLATDEHHFIYSVYNEGQQISEHDLEHLWESFYKSDKARVRTIEGNSGLGLHIVKTVVEKHNGVCWVENKNDGVVFFIKIPKYNEACL